MDRQGIKIKTEQRLFMKMNGLGCWFVELTSVTNHAWESVLNSIQETRGRMLMPMDLWEWYCVRISLIILRPGPFHVRQSIEKKKWNEHCFLSLKYRHRMCSVQPCMNIKNHKYRNYRKTKAFIREQLTLETGLYSYFVSIFDHIAVTDSKRPQYSPVLIHSI